MDAMPLTCSGPLSGQHQWTAWAEPDPDVLQYPVMAAALRHVVRTSGWKLDDVVVWVDLFSIPQANRKLQMSRTFTDFSSPSKGPMEVGSPERMQNQIRTRPWTAQPAARPWTASAPSPDAAGDSAQGAGGYTPAQVRPRHAG